MSTFWQVKQVFTPFDKIYSFTVFAQHCVGRFTVLMMVSVCWYWTRDQPWLDCQTWWFGLNLYDTYGVYYWLIEFQCVVVLDSCSLFSNDYWICYPTIPGILLLLHRNWKTVKCWLQVVGSDFQYVKTLDIHQNWALILVTPWYLKYLGSDSIIFKFSVCIYHCYHSEDST